MTKAQKYAEQAFASFQDSRERQAFYVAMRVKGETHSMAEMLAACRPPGLGLTDTAFLRDSGGRNIDGVMAADYYREIARANGITPDGCRYCPQLASFPGDPAAWVSSVGDAKRVAETKGLKLEGGIQHTPAGYNDVPVDDGNGEYEVADDIVHDHIAGLYDDNPEMVEEVNSNPQKAHDLVEKTKQTLSGKE